MLLHVTVKPTYYFHSAQCHNVTTVLHPQACSFKKMIIFIVIRIMIIIIKDAWGNNHALVVEQLTWDYKARVEIKA